MPKRFTIDVSYRTKKMLKQLRKAYPELTSYDKAIFELIDTVVQQEQIDLDKYSVYMGDYPR